jgi:autotransporter-associated beta strand protein
LTTNCFFGNAAGTPYTASNDLAGVDGFFRLNRLVFQNTTGPVTLAGTNLAFYTSSGAVAPTIQFDSSTNVTVNNRIGLTNTVTLAGSGTGTLTLSGIISGEGGLVVNGAGNFALNNNANSYSGGTIISNGTLVLLQKIGAGSGSITLSGGQLRLRAAAGGYGAGLGYGIVMANSGTIIADNAGNNNIAMSLGSLTISNQTLHKSGNLAALVFRDTVTMTGRPTFNVLGTGGSGDIASLVFSGAVTGTEGFILTGGQSLGIRSANNALSGIVDFFGGTLILANTNALGSATINASNAGTLDIRSTSAYTNSVTIAVGQLTNLIITASLGLGPNALITFAGNLGTLSLGANNAYTNALTVRGNVLLTSSNAYGGTVMNFQDGNLTLNAGFAMPGVWTPGSSYTHSNVNLRVNAANNLEAVANLQINSGTLSFGAVTVTLTSSVTYVGGIFAPVDQAAIVTLNGPLALSSNWERMIGGNGSPGRGLMVINGDISGTGKIRIGAGSSSGAKASTVLAGDNSAWSGGFDLYSTGGGGGVPHIYLYSNTALGTGTNVWGRTGFLYFGENVSGPFANPFNISHVDSLIWQMWSTGSGYDTNGGTTVRINGNLFGVGAPRFQGYATDTDNISELILAGTNNWTGTHSGTAITNDLNFGGSGLAKQVFSPGAAGLLLGWAGADQPTNNVNVLGSTGLPKFGLGAQGFIRFDGQPALPSGAGTGYYAALQKGGNTGFEGLFGFLLTGTGGGATYTNPAGKSFIIGSIGGGGQVGGVFGSADGLAIYQNGLINIHANTNTDTQALSLLVRGSASTLQLGDAGAPVQLRPTYGDQGTNRTTTATTIFARNGSGAATVLKKEGDGILDIRNVEFNYPGGSANDARSQFSWQVNNGMLLYNQNDGALANFAGFAVNAGGTLGGSGKLNSAVTVSGGGTLSPGLSPGSFTVSNLNLATNSNFFVELNGTTAGTSYDQLIVNGSVTIGSGNLVLSLGYTPSIGDEFTIIANDDTDLVTGNFFGLPDGSSFVVGGYLWTITYQGDSGNDVVLSVIPEPGALTLVLVGLAGAALVLRRRR